MSDRETVRDLARWVLALDAAHLPAPVIEPPLAGTMHSYRPACMIVQWQDDGAQPPRL